MGQCAADKPIIVLSLDGAIGPVSAEYVHHGLARAAAEGSGLVLIEIDTPGGLEVSMRRIVQDILSSPVPVAAYVAPAGARAASAGTFIVYASQVAAMAPGTNIGAASPVQIGIGGGSGGKSDANKDTEGGAGKEDKSTVPPGDVHERKAFADASAYIRSLAQLRGRNAEWAEEAVTKASSLSAQEALARHVIDLIASDRGDLLQKLDGRSVSVGSRTEVLHAAGARVVEMPPRWYEQFLAVLTHPSIALILMLLGVYGLVFEFSNPGFVLPGVAGAVCLLLGLYALHLLPVNYAGLALIFLGLAFVVAEAFVPSYGSLGIGGTIAFVIGALILIDTKAPEFEIPWSVIAACAATTLAFVLVALRMALAAHHRPVVSGLQSLVGAEGMMVAAAGDGDWANIRGETWKVRIASPVARGRAVRVVAVDGMVPTVVPLEGD